MSSAIAARVVRNAPAGTTETALAPLLADGAGRLLDLGRTDGFRPLARARHVLSEAMRVENAVTALAAIDTAFYRPRLPPASDPAGHRFVFAPAGAATVTPVA